MSTLYSKIWTISLQYTGLGCKDLPTHQNVYTVRAEEADDEGAHDADHVAGVVEGVRHGQDPSSQAGLQHV